MRRRVAGLLVLVVCATVAAFGDRPGAAGTRDHGSNRRFGGGSGRRGAARVAPGTPERGEPRTASVEPGALPRAPPVARGRCGSRRRCHRVDRLPLRRAPRGRPGSRQAGDLLPVRRPGRATPHRHRHFGARVAPPGGFGDRARVRGLAGPGPGRIRRPSRFPARRAGLVWAHRAHRSGDARRVTLRDLGSPPSRAGRREHPVGLRGEDRSRRAWCSRPGRRPARAP